MIVDELVEREVMPIRPPTQMMMDRRKKRTRRFVYVTHRRGLTISGLSEDVTLGNAVNSNADPAEEAGNSDTSLLKSVDSVFLRRSNPPQTPAVPFLTDFLLAFAILAYSAKLACGKNWRKMPEKARKAQTYWKGYFQKISQIHYK
ncbi:hypothetical protein NECAME_00347 [Necator americanus]|uniref:PiggyBac transposable element-derived protein domain-containing protein n=1 Tax=Necator americanus TaxID=51031 RepID=W2TBK0_NECAM|nr:hypothetical protein NECAME_00347 [Necator americanus]ETN78974.1 hypothetical protein NECAME_00347 [Necator americanus]